MRFPFVVVGTGSFCRSGYSNGFVLPACQRKKETIHTSVPSKPDIFPPERQRYIPDDHRHDLDPPHTRIAIHATTSSSFPFHYSARQGSRQQQPHHPHTAHGLMVVEAISEEVGPTAEEAVVVVIYTAQHLTCHHLARPRTAQDEPRQRFAPPLEYAVGPQTAKDTGLPYVVG